MAGIVSGARMQSPDGFDYSRSHRAVPLPPTAPTPTPTSPPTSPAFPAEASRLRTSGAQQHAGGGHRAQHQPRSRRGSLSSILHRSPSSASHGHSHSNTAPAEAPPLPATLFAHVNAEAALARAESTALGSSGSAFASNRQRSKTANAATSPSPEPAPADADFDMLRKVSRARTAEKERLEQERQAAAAAMPKEPPQLPSLANFHDDAARPDSFAIFNSNPHYPTSPPPQPTANFSRPGNYTMPPSSHANSSSPAYAIRSGNAFAQQQAASSHLSATRTNGEYAEPPESMAHRGRYSYASTSAPANNVSSPRRVRRRKDPTPFK